MDEREEKQAVKDEAEAVGTLIAEEVSAVAEAEALAHQFVEDAAHHAAAAAIEHGYPPERLVKEFWAKLLGEVTRADPNTP